MQIDDNAIVTFHYQLTDGFGELVDSSSGGLPLVYMHNTNAILSSLERELTGARKGDHLSIVIYPEDAYGYADDALIQEWPRDRLRQSEELRPGMRLRAIGSDNEEQLMTVLEVREESVLLDANHPLAGKVLNFVIAIVDVREPTEAEVAAGRAESSGRSGFAAGDQAARSVGG